MSETFGNVVLEAQASGLPVVGYDCQGVNEQVTPGVNGLLVAPGGDLAPELAELCREAHGAATDGRSSTATSRGPRLGADLRRPGGEDIAHSSKGLFNFEPQYIAITQRRDRDKQLGRRRPWWFSERRDGR